MFSHNRLELFHLVHLADSLLQIAVASIGLNAWPQIFYLVFTHPQQIHLALHAQSTLAAVYQPRAVSWHGFSPHLLNDFDPVHRF